MAGTGVVAEGEPFPGSFSATGRVGVIDIGSNTVRLVVYEAPTRLPIPIFNEKAQCSLARGLSRTGVLSKPGVVDAISSISRFVRLAKAMDVEHLEAVGTAAIRDANDGPAFVERVDRECGVHVHVLSGAEEARLAAVGLLNGVPDADGVLGDLGGGSLDLVGLDEGAIASFATLPLGHLRLCEDSGASPQKARDILAKELAKAPWLANVNGRTIYAVGGSWRALARIFIEQTHHPLHIVDNFSLNFFEALRLSNLLSNLSERTLDKLEDVARRRIDTLPYAALALEALLQVACPSQVAFSAYGMREGQMLELLPAALRSQDSLISACESHAERTGRFAMHGQEILDWMSPLFPGETEAERRLRLAACLLSDIGWTEHPDYRAVHAYQRVLRIPYPGLSHTARAEIALAVLVRYDGKTEDSIVYAQHSLLGNGRQARAETIGLALRLAHTLSGGAPGLLSKTRLKLKHGRVILHIPAKDTVFLSDAVEKRFRNLGRRMELKPEIVEGGA